MKTKSEHRIFDGVQGFYEADSEACGGPMKFSVFMPPKAKDGQGVPALYYLSGLECSEVQLPQKAAAQKKAAELGLALVACDTSPRSERYEGDDASWDFGTSAGFYLDATQAPWSKTYRMETHIVSELIPWVEKNFAVNGERRGIFGHSMGGHGALTLGLRHPKLFQSISAFAPIVAPSQVPWGQKAFTGYLGEKGPEWAAHDACELVLKSPHPSELLVDVGTGDKFLERELKPELFEAACAKAGQELKLRRQSGYDHSYFFISTFMADHLHHHARILGVG